MTSETHIREADSTDASLLSGLVSECFRDVAERFDLTLENCPKHPSHCTDEWIENDFARGVTFYILESDVIALGCVAIEKAGSDDPQKVRDALATHEFGKSMDGMMQPGQIKFDETGWNSHTFPTMIQWQNGKPTTVFPESVATSKVISPKK